MAVRAVPVPPIHHPFFRITHALTHRDYMTSKSDESAAIFHKAFKLARRQCANYTEFGPSRKRHYCCSEPKETQSTCLLLADKPCDWFSQRVLPTNIDLQRQWMRYLALKDGCGNGENFKKCSCGSFFKPRSNRQQSCGECKEKKRRGYWRKYKQTSRSADTGSAVHI